MKGDTHSGGNTIGGGLGCGAQHTGLPPPITKLPRPVPGRLGRLAGMSEVVCSEELLDTSIWMFFLPRIAQMLPPPAWQPVASWPLLNTTSNAQPSAMSPTDVTVGLRRSR